MDEKSPLLIHALLGALDQLPSCRSLDVHMHTTVRLLSDPDLAALLHHPTVRGCKELSLRNFRRSKAELMPADGERSHTDRLLARSQGLRRVAVMCFSGLTNLLSRRKLVPFGWADIRLPAVTSLRLDVQVRGWCNDLPYTGGIAFLTSTLHCCTWRSAHRSCRPTSSLLSFTTRPHCHS